MLPRLVFLLLFPAGVMAQTPPDVPPGTLCSDGRLAPRICIRPPHMAFDICQAIADSARAHGISPHFLARLLWQESRFDPHAVSPAKARGIAQFIASTAALRGLRDVFNPAEAIDRSAHYLAELTARFGNPGLAAIAYNGGEARAARLLQDAGASLPRETRDYVRIITGLNAADWLATPAPSPDLRLDRQQPFLPACLTLAQTRRLTALAPPEPRRAPWGVQLAFGTTKKIALARFATQTRRCRGDIGRQKPDLVWDQSRASPTGGYFMARLGRPTLAQAKKLCGKLARRGCRCLVKRNPA